MNTEEKCPFCLENNLLRVEVLYEDETWYFAGMKEGAIQNAGMAITKRHVPTPFEFTKDEWNKLHDLLPKFKEILNIDSPLGYNLGWNVHAVGGQHVDHAHLHIVARYDDEPLAGKGIRYAFKGENNKRTTT